MKKRIAILGTAPSWKDAPKGAGWQIWVCNRAGLQQEPWDRLFEIHHNLDYESPRAKSQYLRDLSEVKPPQEVITIMPLSTLGLPMPAERVIDRKDLASRYGMHWLSCSHAYMLAMAIDEQPDEIGIWGIEMESVEEYIPQWLAVDHLIKVAESRGITVTMPERCHLLREPNPYPDRFETTLAYYLESKVEICQKAIPGWEAWLVEDDELKERLRDFRAVQFLRGQLHALRCVQRLFVWDIAQPDIGDSDDAMTHDHL